MGALSAHTDGSMALPAPGGRSAQGAGSDVYAEESLYDLQADPYELANLIGRESHQEVAAVMRERLIRSYG